MKITSDGASCFVILTRYYVGDHINTQHRTLLLNVVLHGCETWSVMLGEEHRLRVFRNRVVRKIFLDKRGKVQESGENYIRRSFMFFTSYKILCA